MCICDNKDFKITNMVTNHIKLYNQAGSIARKFKCTKRRIFYYLNHKGFYLYLNGEHYKVEANKHLDCVMIRDDLHRRHGVRIKKIPDKYRHILPLHRQ